MVGIYIIDINIINNKINRYNITIYYLYNITNGIKCIIK